MNLANLYREALNAKFVAVYDIAYNNFSLRWKEHYEDSEEAGFFGNQVSEGQSLGFISDGVRDFKTSIQDHVYLGKLRSLMIAKENEYTKVNIEYMRDEGDAETVCFICLNVYLEMLEGNRIARHKISMI